MKTARGTFVSVFAAAIVAAASFFFSASASAQPVQVAPTAEHVGAFAADITVNADGTISVVEKIDYVFVVQRHGIIRELPLEYRGDDGEIFRIPLEVTAVSQDGAAAQYQVTRRGAMLEIRIGEPDTSVSGFHSYVIAYTASGALRYFSDHDELYWNVTGVWDVPIARSGATVHAPEGVDGTELTLACYTDSAASDCLHNVQGDKAYFAANGPLTVAVGWPPGKVAKLLPQTPSALEVFFRDFPWASLLLLAPITLLAYLTSRWIRHGRDARGSGTLVVQYDPPKASDRSTTQPREHMTPAECGAIVDELVNAKDVTATLVDLAVRGYLFIRETEETGILFKEKQYALEKRKEFEGDATLFEYEKEVMRAVFASGDSATLADLKKRSAFHKKMPLITNALYDRMTRVLGLFTRNPADVRKQYGGVGGALLVLGLYGAFQVSSVSLTDFLSMGLVATAACGGILLAFSYLMVQKSPAGAVAFDHVLGFKEYLATAEKYRLEWQETEHMFERFLPYAMAFGIVEKWTKAFADVAIARPTWYEGNAWRAGAFNAAAFASSWKSFDTALMTAAKSTPQQSSSRGSSGLSGGRFGGGGGGGGGRSW